jgi:hypothetical protein
VVVKSLMSQGFLLTDDEVVALAALAGAPWPFGLATVLPTAEALRAAALRGVRSLDVRGVLRRGPDSGAPAVVAEPIADAVAAFVHSARQVGAYLAPHDDSGSVAGPAVTAVVADGQWWMDTATSEGVHGIRKVDRGQLLAAITAFAEQTHTGTLLRGVPDPGTYVCVVRTSGSGDQCVTVPAAADGHWSPAVLDPVLTTLDA